MPSTPRRAASRASSTCWMPLTRIGSEVSSRSQARSSQVSAGLAWTPRKWPVAAPRSSSGGLLEAGAEDRVLEVVGDAHPVEEGQPGLLQVARLPAGDEGVDGDDDRAVAGRLGAADEALDQLAVVGPVELEPARRAVAAGLGDLLEGEVGGGAGDHRHADRRRGAGGRQLALVVDDLLDADRGQQQRRRHRRAEHRGREVALGDVAQHPRHDPAPAEGLAVGVASCPRCRRRRRRSWPPAAPSPRSPRAPARRPRPGPPASRRPARGCRSRGSSRRGRGIGRRL